MASMRELRQEIEEVHRERHFNRTSGHFTDCQRQIIESIRTKNSEKFRRLLSRGVDPDFLDSTGSSPLHTAVGLQPNDDVSEIVHMLVYFGTSLESRDRFGHTPLHIASSCCAQNVRLLLEAGAKVDVQDNAGRTSLMEACSSDNREALTMIQYLLDRDANVHLKDEEGLTALHCVCKNNHQDLAVRNEIVYKLLYAGLSSRVTDNMGNMAICHELQRFVNMKSRNNRPVPDSHLAVIRTLIHAGSNYSYGNKLHERWVKYALNFSNKTVLSQLLSVAEPVLSLPSLKQLRTFTKSLDEQDDEDTIKLLSQLKQMSRTVKSLKGLSRIVIREELKGKLLVSVESLIIPKTLRNFLILQE